MDSSALVAIAVFNHCSVYFYELTCKDESVAFRKVSKQMENIHKIPVKTIRLSKKQPNLLVTFGDESDLTIKLWNIA